MDPNLENYPCSAVCRADRQTERQRDRETERQRDRETETETGFKYQPMEELWLCMCMGFT